MWQVRLAGRDRDSFVEIRSGERAARLGTAAARELVATRTRRLYPGAANLDLFFASQALASLQGTPGTSRAIRTVLEDIWRRVSAESPHWKESSLDEMKKQLNRGFHGGSTRAVSGLDGEDSLGTLRRFVSAVYDATGVNLVQLGILSTPIDRWNYDGTVAPLSPLLGGIELGRGASARVSIPRSPSALVGARLDAIPIDVFYDIVLEQWRQSERQLEPRGRATAWLGEYVGGDAGEGHAPSVAVRRFKETGAIADARPILDRAATASTVAALKERLVGNGANVLFVPVPGSDGTNGAPAALATWLRGELGFGTVSDSLRLEGAGAPQKAQPSLWHRITNQQRRDYRVSPAIRGKVVVLVDDVLTSGASTQLLKLRLLEGGATAVYVFGLAKTRHGDSADDVPLLSIVTPSTAPEPFREAMPMEPSAFAPWFETWLERGEPLPWQGRNGGASPENAVARLAFSHRIALWIRERIEDRKRVAWLTKARNESTKTEIAAQAAVERAFAQGDLAFLKLLPPAVFSLLTPVGKPVTARTKSLAASLYEDDSDTAAGLARLHGARDDTDFAELRESPYGRMVLGAARDRFAASPTFRNQLGRGSPLATWLEANP